MAIPSETVAIPLVRGLDLTTDERLLDPPNLLEAENARFGGGGSKKRRGHVPLLVRGEGSPLGTGANYLFGVGRSQNRGTAQEDIEYWVGDSPEAVTLYGVAPRDDETVVWDGHRLFSYLPSQANAQASIFADSGNAVMPSLHAFSTAKSNLRQSQPELGDNGLTRLVVWIDDTTSPRVTRYEVQDSVSGSVIATGTFSAVVNPKYIRVVTLGAWMHAFVFDQDTNVIRQFSIVSTDPNSVTTRSLGDANGGHFDLWKVSDSLVLVVKTHDAAVQGYFIQTNGTGSSTISPFVVLPDSGTPTLITCARSPTTGQLGLAWWNGTNIAFALCNNSNVKVYELSFAPTGTPLRITIAPHYATTENGYDIWDVWWDNGSDLYRRRFWADGVSAYSGAIKFRKGLRVASRAFRVGDRPFVWVGKNSAVQSLWYLLDEGMKPVGHLDFGLANVGSVTGGIAGVNWAPEPGSVESVALEVESPGDPPSPPPSHDGEGYLFHLALSHKLRAVPDDSAQATGDIYTEPGVKAVYLDFLPSLRSAQAGRALYFPGAQLWSYDGKEVVEAGFHTGPEVTLVQSAGGSLTADGTYSYRVDVCYRNAQNEEVRSLSILSDSIELTGGGGGNRTITVDFDPVLTRRDDSYFLIYRNAMSGGVPLTNWWLLNSRDPSDASFLANTQTSTGFSVIDDGTVSDTDIQTRELHPAADTFLQPISAPACEVVAAGRDRLWVAGGELLPGELAPSRLFDPGETPSFNAYLNIQVDRSNEPVTALGFIGEVAAIFRPTSTYILDSDGPDNIAQGFWNPPRLAIADVGAQSQESVQRITQGLIFQSSVGFRLLGPGGALTPIGVPVDDTAGSFSVVGGVVVEKDQEVRFYGVNQTLVYNYLYDRWALWTVGGVGVALDPDTGYALVARNDGYLWIETPGTWTDGGHTYTHRIRTSWLRGGQLGDFQRVRRVGGIGRYADPSDTAHSVRLELYYDSREFWEDRHDWTLPDSTTNQDTWGAGTWGAGVWGDTSATISNLEDLVWDWQRDPAIQKCTAISIAVQDYNTDGPGFELAALTLELARKPGLNRGPTRSGTGTYR